MAHTSPALVVTTAILVISFGTFMFATFTPNKYFGVLTALIFSVALITDLSFLPALLLKRESKKKAGKGETSLAGSIAS